MNKKEKYKWHHDSLLRLWVSVEKDNIMSNVLTNSRVTPKPHWLVVDADAWQNSKEVVGFRCFKISGRNVNITAMTRQAGEFKTHPAGISVWVEMVGQAERMYASMQPGVGGDPLPLHEVRMLDKGDLINDRYGC